MKFSKITVVIAALMLFAVLLTSCAGGPKELREAQSLIKDGNLGQAKAVLYKVLDNKDAKELFDTIIGTPAHTLLHDFDGAVINTDSTFNDKGQVISTVKKIDDGYSSETKYTYENDLLVREDTTDSTGDSSSTVYTYDANGNCIKEESTGDMINYVIENTYDEQNRKTASVWNFFFDSEDFDSATNIEYIYDDNGNLIKEITRSSDSTEIVEETIYDDNNNPISAKIIKNGENVISEETFTYDEKGNLIENVNDYDDTTFTDKFEYDDFGNVIRNTHSYYDKEVKKEDIDIYTYEYSDNGDLLKETYTYSDGSTAVYEYTDYVYSLKK